MKSAFDGRSVRAFLRDRDLALTGGEVGADAIDLLGGLGLIPAEDSDSRAVGKEGGWEGGDKIVLPPGSGRTAMDFLSAFLSQKLAYKEGEEDMVILSHEILASSPSPRASVRAEEAFTSTLMVTGMPSSGHSAMARTVGIPLAIATREVLEHPEKLVEVTGGGGVCGGGVVWESVMSGIEDGYGGGEGGFQFVEERKLNTASQSMERVLGSLG